MRIVFVSPEYVTENNYDGGLSNYLYRVTQYLVNFEHDPIVVVSSDHDEIMNQNGVTVYRVATKQYIMSILNCVKPGWLRQIMVWCYQSWALNKTVRHIHRGNPVSLIQYSSYAITGIFRLWNVPCVVRLSSYQPLWVSGYGYDYGKFADIVSRFFEDTHLKMADAIFSPSELLAQIVGEKVGKPVSVIEPPFLPVSVDTDETLCLSQMLGKKYLLFFGTLSVLKGVVIIADILFELFEKYDDLYFVFIGKDAGYKGKKMIDHLRCKAEKYSDRVIYFDRLHHNQLFPFIKYSYAVVIPSIIDNFPNTCIESMTCGRIVIGTRGASFEQMLNDGESGFLCEIDDSASLLATIQKVMALDESERNMIGLNAINRINELKPDVTVSRLIDYYNRVIEKMLK